MIVQFKLDVKYLITKGLTVKGSAALYVYEGKECNGTCMYQEICTQLTNITSIRT
jgi:hypothetical protein